MIGISLVVKVAHYSPQNGRRINYRCCAIAVAVAFTCVGGRKQCGPLLRSELKPKRVTDRKTPTDRAHETDWYKTQARRRKRVNLKWLKTGSGGGGGSLKDRGWSESSAAAENSGNGLTFRGQVNSNGQVGCCWMLRPNVWDVIFVYIGNGGGLLWGTLCREAVGEEITREDTAQI